MFGATNRIAVRRVVLAAAVGLAILFSIAHHTSLLVRAQLSTDDHLAEPGWWPRQTSRSLDDYAGSPSCARCHKEKAATQKTTPMARTLMRAEDAGTLHSRSQLLFRNSKYLYKITTSAEIPEYSVSDGERTLSAPLEWAFGTGEVGQSYLFRKNGKYYESRVTYFSTLKNIHFTPTRALLAPGSLEEAMARPLEIGEIKRCFACHSTSAVIGGVFEASKLTVGVT